MAIDNEKLAIEIKRLRDLLLGICEHGASRKRCKAAGDVQRALDHLRYVLSQETRDPVFWNVPKTPEDIR